MIAAIPISVYSGSFVSSNVMTFRATAINAMVNITSTCILSSVKYVLIDSNNSIPMRIIRKKPKNTNNWSILRVRKGALYISPHSFHPSLKVESNMTMIIIMMRMYIIAFSNNLSLLRILLFCIVFTFLPFKINFFLQNNSKFYLFKTSSIYDLENHPKN